jgi:hypothetical protein
MSWDSAGGFETSTVSLAVTFRVERSNYKSRKSRGFEKRSRLAPSSGLCPRTEKAFVDDEVG